MTRKKRYILLFIVSFLFTITALSTIFYSLGWRIDWREKKIVQTGVFYFRVWPISSDVKIIPIQNNSPQENNSIEKKTGAFLGSVYIENLIPKKYKIIIEKEGFYPWEKILEIKEGNVTESKNIVLIKKEPFLNRIEENIINYFVSPEEKKIIFIKNNDIILFDIPKNKKTSLGLVDIFLKDNEDILGIIFSKNEEKIILETKEKYFLANIEEIPVNISSLDVDGSLNILFNPSDSDSFIIYKDNNLIEINIKGESKIIYEEVISFSLYREKIYYLNKQGFLIFENEKINKEALKIKESAEYNLYFLENFIFVKEDDLLYILEEEKFVPFSDPVKNLKTSPDNGKLLIHNDNEIKIFFLRDQNDQPLKKEKETLFLSRFSEKIEDIFWWTNHYLIFNKGNEVKIIETDDRDSINIFNLTKLKEPKMFWSNLNKKLFILSENNFFISERLIP